MIIMTMHTDALYSSFGFCFSVLTAVVTAGSICAHISVEVKHFNM